MPPPTDLATQLTSILLTRHSLLVSADWLHSFVSTVRAPAPPLVALTSTAQFRLLNSDFTAVLASDSNPASPILLPLDVGDPTVKERRLAGNVPVQVLDVEDVGASRWGQVERIERVEAGEEVRGREVIRTLPPEATEGPAPAAPVASGAASGKGPHKYLLQDARGTVVSAFEKVTVPKLGLGDEGMCIGIKVMLKSGTVVRRGVVMLRPENVTVLGGKVEGWDDSWKAGRKDRLKRMVEEQAQQAQAG